MHLRRRSWLAVAYVLATLMAQGGHDHGETHDSRPLVGCDDPRAGMAGHHTPDLGRLPSDCTACQLRAEIPFWQMPPTGEVRRGVEVDPVRAPDAPSARPLRSAPSRAPPRV